MSWQSIGSAAEAVIQNVARERAKTQPEAGRKILTMIAEAVTTRPDGPALARNRADLIERDLSRAFAGDDKVLDKMARMGLTGPDASMLIDAIRHMADLAEGGRA